MSYTFARLSRAPAPCIRSFRHLSTTRTLRQSTIPTTATCPSPSCACASTPPDLDIDRETPLLNTMAAYSEQVVLCTGQEDWHSNIEQENGPTGAFVKGLKGVIGKGGKGFDVCPFPFLCRFISCMRSSMLTYQIAIQQRPHHRIKPARKSWAKHIELIIIPRFQTYKRDSAYC